MLRRKYVLQWLRDTTRYMAAFNLYQQSIEFDGDNLQAWKNIASMHYFIDGVQEDKEMARHIQK